MGLRGLLTQVPYPAFLATQLKVEDTKKCIIGHKYSMEKTKSPVYEYRLLKTGHIIPGSTMRLCYMPIIVEVPLSNLKVGESTRAMMVSPPVQNDEWCFIVERKE